MSEELEDMDEEMERVRKDADGVDIYKHRRRYRLFKAVLLGAALAGLTALILAMIDGGTNPCARVRDYFCKKDPAGIQCKSYVSLVDDSQHDSSPAMRSNIRAQCETKIERLKSEDGIVVK